MKLISPFLERDYIQRGLLTYGLIKIVMIHVIKGTVDPHTLKNQKFNVKLSF